MQAVILAAGKSTRAYPLTVARPKPLLKLMNKPILAHLLDALGGLADEVVLVVGFKKELIEAAFGSTYNGLPIRYVEQAAQLGTGHALLQSARLIQGPFLALNGDGLVSHDDLRRLAAAEQAALVKRVSDPRSYGVFEVTEQNRVIRLIEKPSQVFSDLANAGAYKFTPEIFRVLNNLEPSGRGELELTAAIQILAEHSDFRAVEVEDYWLPIGYPWDLLNANEYFLNMFLEHRVEGDVSPSAHINGRVSIGEGTVVRSGVVIDGPVCLGKNCAVGPNCWLRSGTTLGDGCRVGHAVEVKNSILMDGATVSHLSYVGDSILGEFVNLGAGTITANLRHDGKNVFSVVKGERVDTGRRKLGAILGDHVHTGINTSIYEGRKLWPHTFTYPGETLRKDVTEIKRVPQR